MSSERSEDGVRDLLMKVLYVCVGVDGSWQGEGKRASFDVAGQSLGGVCEAEGSLKYVLPKGGSLSHKTDILITARDGRVGASGARYLGIEVKHQSAVTDVFKSRAYDMLHLKQTFGGQLLGLLVYVRWVTGISFEQAQKICYPYDHFIGIEFSKLQEPGSLAALAGIVAKEIGVTLKGTTADAG